MCVRPALRCPCFVHRIRSERSPHVRSRLSQAPVFSDARRSMALSMARRPTTVRERSGWSGAVGRSICTSVKAPSLRSGAVRRWPSRRLLSPPRLRLGPRQASRTTGQASGPERVRPSPAERAPGVLSGAAMRGRRRRTRPDRPQVPGHRGTPGAAGPAPDCCFRLTATWTPLLKVYSGCLGGED